MELPRVAPRAASLAALLLVLVAAALAGPAPALAADPGAPVIVEDLGRPPPGYRLTALAVRRIAARDAKVRAELRRHPLAKPFEYTKGPGRWQVSWFSAGPKARELAQVYVADRTGRVLEVWTGFQVAWTMARGYPGAFGRQVTAWYVWIPMCLLFALPFLPLRGGRRRLSLLHLDLAVLLAFSLSLACFNHARIGLSVPLTYPCLLYLLVRMLLLAGGRGRPRQPLRLLVPVSWLAIATVFLIGFRVGLNIADSNVIDVGYAGVIGADKLLHGHHLYGGWPHDNANGDTYGPVAYMAYVPFRALLGWSGAWDDLPAGHGAAIAFDLLTLGGLFLLGRRVRGPTAGIVLAYAWAAYPFTLYALSSNTNDSLVALMIVVALLVARWAPARGAMAALAGLTKFAPLALAPLLLRGPSDSSRRSAGGRRERLGYGVGFVTAAALVLLPVLLEGNVNAFWRDTVVYQSGRGSPFSIWGLWGGLGFEQRLVQGAAVALALTAAFVPRRRGMVELSAMGAAVLIALQLGISHWFYLYIPWFFPLVLVALVAAHPPPGRADVPAVPGVPAERAASSGLGPEPAPAPAHGSLA